MTIEQILYFSMLGLALAGYIVILSSIPYRRKKIFAQSGNLIMPLSVKSSKKWAAIAVMAFILILIVPLRNYGWFVNIVLLGAALFAVEIAAREAGGIGKAGIYQNMLVSGTSALLWSDILSFPTLAYENDEETTQVDFKTLRVIAKNGAEHLILFESEEERSKAVETILNLAPDLKP
ncbi:hypothetical protein [Treponema sp.]|uniref:hypothetical protein n=1 Tax=Treponema sp. TaxID=166 RepID=UPI00388DFBDD